VILRRPRGGHKITLAFFELDRGPVGQGRVEPATIVDVLDEGADCVAGLTHITIISAVDLLLLECQIASRTVVSSARGAEAAQWR
jgi:hypothetical protein